MTKVNFFIPLLSGKTPLYDFDIYYRLSGDLLKGINPYQVSYMRTWGPPLVFIYYLPFQLLNLENARTAATLINIFSGLLTSIILVVKFFPKNKFVSFLGLSAILFSSFPGRFTLESGQPNMLLTLFITGIIISVNTYVKSLLLSFLISFKTFFLLSTLSFIKTEKRVFYISILLIAIVAGILLLLIKPGLYYFYYNVTLPELLSGNSAIVGTDYYNQTYFSTLARLGISFPDKTLYSLAIIICSVIIYVIGRIDVAVILSLIFSLISWQHYYVILFPIYIKAFRDSPKSFYDYLTVGILMGFWWIEFPWIHTARLSTFSGLLASHYFLSALLLAIYLLTVQWLTSSSGKSYNTGNENKF